MPETKNVNKPFDAKETVDSFMQALKSDKLYRMVPSDSGDKTNTRTASSYKQTDKEVM